jgi:multiple sugar transport system permease protein
MTDRRLKYLLLLPALLGLAAVTFYPTLFLLKSCFYRIDLAGNQGRFVGLAHFIRLFQDPLLGKAVLNTGILTVSSVGLELLLGLALALAVHHAVGFKGGLRTMLLLPMVISPIVVAVSFRLLYDTSFGVINGFLSYFHIPLVPWLSSPRLALGSLVLVDLWEWTPFVFLILLAGLAAIPHEPYEAAEIDGATAWQQFRDITLPLLRPAVMVAVLLRSMDCLRLFDSVYILTRGGPGNATETISYFIYRTAFENFDLGYASAISFVVLALTLGVSKLFIRGLTPSGAKS